MNVCHCPSSTNLVWWCGSLQDCTISKLYSFSCRWWWKVRGSEWMKKQAASLPSVTENLHWPQEETQVWVDTSNKMHLRFQARDTGPSTSSPTPLCTIFHLIPRMESNVSSSATDLSVTDGAECLQVVQGALSSSTGHWPDVIHLPEMPFPRVSYHFIKLQ